MAAQARSNGASQQVEPLPGGWTVQPAVDLKTRNGGRILIGGAPLKIIRLSATGGELARAWFGGAPVDSQPAHQRLARRLIGAGMANPTPAQASGQITEAGGPVEPDARTGAGPMARARLDDVTVVIPVHNDPRGLEQTVSALLTGPDEVRILVMDDGSSEPVTIDHPMIRVVRSADKTGPGAARQRALPGLDTGYVAFVDAGVVLSPADLSALVVAMDDRRVLAVAPRVLSKTEPHLVGRYDSRRSPLDLGPVESLVGPGRLVPYVPTACLLARTDSLREVGGFDPELRYGEDVDLIWRLCRQGDVRYLPTITVTHPPRISFSAMVAQRRGYGSAAAPLAARHGDAVSPCSLSPWSALVIGLFATGHPIAGTAAATGTGLALRPKIAPLPDLTVEAFQLTFRGHWYGGLSALTALARTWSPAALAAFVLRRSWRRRIGGLLLLAFARRLLDGPRAPQAALTDLSVGVVDDLAYAWGVWRGAVQGRSFRALLPTMNSWPKGPDAAKPDRD